jgi:MFS family permease
VESHREDFALANGPPQMFRTLHYVKKRAVNPAHALALCYAGMVCLAIAVNLMPTFLTTVQVDLGGKAVLTHEQLGRISALTFAGLVGGILFTGPLADRWGGKLFSILGTLLIGVGLVLLGISPTYSMVLVAVFVMGLGAGILDMVLSPIVAALQPDSRAKALNWLHSFYGIGTVITVLVGAFAFRLGIGWRTTSLTLITVPLLVALGFVNVDLPPLISNKAGERTALRDLCRNSSFVAVNAAIFLGGALELGLAQWLPAYAEMSLGFSKWTGSVSLLAFSAAMALGRILAGLIGRRVDSIRLMLGCLDFRCALLLACFAPWPAVALAASVAVGLAGSCLWPTTLGVAADRFPQGGATMFGLLAAFGNLGGNLNAVASRRYVGLVVPAAGLGHLDSVPSLDGLCAFVDAAPSCCRVCSAAISTRNRNIKSYGRTWRERRDSNPRPPA